MSTEYQKQFEEIFTTLATGTAVKIKEAKNLIQNKWKAHHKEFSNALRIIQRKIETFDSIQNPINKSAVITGMSMFYLALADENFVLLKDFIIKNLQDPDGRVREAARKTGEWLYSSLVERADPFIYPEGKKISEKQVIVQGVARKQYIDFVNELERLIEKYDNGEENELEYIDDMKPSVHKSLQMMWGRLSESPIYREILEKNTPVTLEIFDKRKEIEKDLVKLLEDCEVDPNISVDDIKQMIYEEDSVKGMSNLIRLFDNGDQSNLDNVLQTVGDAWNYFPHKSISGKCPFEMYSVK